MIMRRIYAVIRMTQAWWSGTEGFYKQSSAPAINLARLWPFNKTEEREVRTERITETYHPGFRLIVTHDHVDWLNAVPDENFMGERTKRVRGKGETYLFMWEGQNKLTEDLLAEASYRLEILTQNAWQFDLVLVWGETEIGLVVPLALEERTQTLSTDPTEGFASIPIRPVDTLSRNDRFTRLLVVVSTADTAWAGTESVQRFRLRIEKTNGDPIVDRAIPETTQSDLKRGWTNVYDFQIEPLRTREIERIVLSTTATDMWIPSHIRLFGVSQGRVLPIVDRGDLPALSTQLNDQPGNTASSVELPLLE
jgi:hypothetical protein